jgi:hypothetical protein
MTLIVVARVFRRGVFLVIGKKNLASEEASYNEKVSQLDFIRQFIGCDSHLRRKCEKSLSDLFDPAGGICIFRAGRGAGRALK